MLKRILVMLLSVLMAISFFVSFRLADLQERETMREASQGLGESFALPMGHLLEDPEIVLRAFERASAESGVNLFRTAVGYDADGRSYVAHFILLATDQTAFFEPFRLREGRFLDSEETQSASRFLSTEKTDDAAQVGVLDDIGRNDIVRVHGLSAAFDSLPTAGSYVVEFHSQTDLDTFYNVLLADLTSVGVEVTRDEVASDSSVHSGGESEADPWNWMMIWSAILMVAILVIFRQLYESKRTGVLLLYGNGIISTWFNITGRIIVCTMAILSLVSIIAAALVPGTTSELLASTVSFAIAVTFFTLLASLVTVPYITNMKIHEALKTVRI